MAITNMEKAIKLMVWTNKSQREIAKELDVQEETVSRWKKHKDFDSIRQREEREYLGDLAAPALRTMKELLKAKSELVRYNAASDILDRTGYKPTDKQEVDINGAVQFVDDIGSGLDDG